MSYELLDQSGRGEMFANIPELQRLREHTNCPPSLARFMATGKADARQLAQIQAECSLTPGFRRAGARFKGMAAPVVLTDGATSSKPWEALSHGRDWRGEDPSGWLASEKLDGVRAYWDGSTLWTRGGMEIRLPRITRRLPAGFALDGELYAGRGNLQIARVAAQNGKDAPSVRFVAFDAPEATGDWPARMGAARKVWRNCVPLWTVKDRAHLLARLAKITAAGGEGIVIRKPGTPYTVGRVKTMLKVKP